MALKTIAELKTYFLTGLKPTQQQFHDWLDSFYHKSEGIPIENISGLQNILDNVGGGEKVQVNGSHEIIIPIEGMLDKIVVWASSDTVVNVGDSNGTGEYISDENITANTPYIFDLALFSIAAKSVFVSGNGTFNLKICMQ